MAVASQSKGKEKKLQGVLGMHVRAGAETSGQAGGAGDEVVRVERGRDS